MSGQGISNEVEVVGELLLAGIGELIESTEEKLEFVIINDEMMLSTSVSLFSDFNGSVAEQIESSDVGAFKNGVVDSKGEEIAVVDCAAVEDGFVKACVEEISLVDVGTIDDVIISVEAKEGNAVGNDVTEVRILVCSALEYSVVVFDKVVDSVVINNDAVEVVIMREYVDADCVLEDGVV